MGCNIEASLPHTHILRAQSMLTLKHCLHRQESAASGDKNAEPGTLGVCL